MYTYLEESLYLAMRTRSKQNIFRDYLSFLDKLGELSEVEQALVGNIAHKFLKEIENTSMSKMYKIPVFLAT